MKKKWAILLYGLGISGGANVIFQHAMYAVSQGIEVTIVSMNGQTHVDASWHEAAGCFDYKKFEDIVTLYFDVAIATEWRSAFDIYKVHADKYIYFVQSIESKFFQRNNSLLGYIAETSYDMPMEYVTEVTWIKEYLLRFYHKKAELVLNGIDKKIFTCDGKRIDERPVDHVRFLIEGSMTNWLKNVPKAIEVCKKAGADDVWLVTPDRVKKIEDFGVSRFFSKVPMKMMPEIYRSCDVLVKLSVVEGMFGPPLEMFHCGGTAITYDVEGSEEYMIDGENSFVLKKGDEKAVIGAVKRLIEDRNELNRLKENALKTAKDWIDWNHSSECFFEAIDKSTKINDEDYEIIQKKGKKGSDSYKQAEALMGLEPDMNRIEKLREFCRRETKKLFLYGAGKMCRGTILNLDQYDISIEGILVSSIDNNPNTVMGHRVYEIDKVMDKKDSIVIFVTSDIYYSEIFYMLQCKGFMDVF
ncbi:Glycosyl transferases group 1 [Lachnospiraceae bacterium]|nr:Glycosyl transferases group 1 [Lachnospiraceae bacterium]